MKPDERANELYPNNSTFCGGVAQIARDAFAKGARMQKEVDDKELSEKVSAAYQLGLSDREKQMMAGAVEGVFLNNPYPTICLDDCEDYDFKDNQDIRIIIVNEEKNGTE